ncbi:MAG: hypothetical protein M0036_19875 [Desulfobacteraceae bacterium]|nr:hypothetical protein [Desulfobacteraceae bacterium]
MKLPSRKRCSGGFEIAIAAWIITAITMGCGIKAAPVPPNRSSLTTVTALKGRLEDNRVTLTWPNSGGNASYLVLRATSDPAKPCPGCPLVFQTIGTAKIDPATESVTYSELVASGFVYTYKVQPVGSAGDRGSDSNMVVIDRSAQ